MRNNYQVPPPAQEIRRGDIFYVVKESVGLIDAKNGRPAIIVSNDKCNTFSDFVEIVFLTTKDKKPLPTHVEINSARISSTALCEQIQSVNKTSLSDHIGTCTAEEMTEVDEALRVSLGLSEVKKEYVETSDVQSWKSEAERWKALYEGLIDRLIKTK